ncbi:MAG: hypothetical protein M0R02_03680 [Bacteroidales bacterium]|nr:hypothetical protein [Bacteroidales bacterium]
MKTSIVPYRFFILLFAALLGVVGGVSAQPFTVTAGANMSNLSPVTACGTNFTFSLQQKEHNQANFTLKDNGVAMTSSTWKCTNMSYLGWTSGLWGTSGAAGAASPVYYYVINPATKHIEQFSTPPVCDIPTDPSITVTPATIPNLGYVVGTATSPAQKIIVTGANLEAANITITIPADFQLSTTSATTGFGDIGVGTTVLPDGATDVWIRLAPGQDIGNYSGNVTVASATDGITKTVAVAAEVVQCVDVFDYSGATLNSNLLTADGTSIGSENWCGYPFMTVHGNNNGYVYKSVALTTGMTYTLTITSPACGGNESGDIKPFFSANDGSNPQYGTQVTFPANNAASITYQFTVSTAGTYRVGLQKINHTGSGVTVDGMRFEECVMEATIEISSASLSGFTYCNGSGPSAEQSFTVTGINVTNDISITPPAGYEISLTSGGPYQTSSLTLTESEGAVPATPIYVRLQQGLSTGDKTGNIEITSTDADNKTVALTGEVAGAVITVSNATLSGFSYCDGHGPSNWQSYTVSGVCLSENITITAPTNYEISTSSESGYGNSITLSQSGGVVNATTMYVRLKAGKSANNYTENITHASTAATSQNVSCSGTVTPQPIVTLASASQVAAAEVQQHIKKHALSAFTAAVTNASASISSIAFTTTGTYAATDITKFQLWYNTSNNFAGATQIGTDITSSLDAGTHTFSGFTQSIAAGNTGYFWITTDFNPTSTIGNTIAVSAISDVTLSTCGTVTGSVTAAGEQTIIETDGMIYYSRQGGNWNDGNTWSTEGCGGTAATSYPGETDIVIICNHTVTAANVDITTKPVTVQSGGKLIINDNRTINSDVTVESGGILEVKNGALINSEVIVDGTITWPNNTIKIGANANIMVNGNINAPNTTIEFQDEYDGVEKGKITATGSMNFSRVRSKSGSVTGGSLKAESITINTYGENEKGVDVAFEGPTTIATYMGYGYTYFTNGDLTITNYNSNNNSSVPLNEIVSLNGDLKFTNKVTTKNSSLQTNIDGDIYFNNGFENAYKGTPDTRLIAHNIYITNELKGEGDTNTYLEANVIQTGTLAINQNSHGNIYIKNDFDSNTFGTTFNNTNATFKIEGNSHFDNISGHLNASASLITLGDSYMGGSGTFGANDGPLYVGGQLVIDKVQVSFQGSAYGYIGNVYEASEFIDKGMYNGLYDGDTQVGGTGNHPRDADNNPNENEGKYISIGGGQITSASMIKDLSEAETAGLNITPESWSTPLPIELVEFYADITEHNYVEVFWTTATETNNDYFTLYRSNNGITFNPIAEIAGAGTTVYQTTYSYLDASFYTGTSYYKFSQTDYDGSVHFSKTIAVYIKPNSVTYLFLPDKIHVSFADSVQSHHVMISSVDGRILFSKGFHNTTQTEIPMPHETGVFIISTLSSKGIVNQKFVR